MDKSARLGDSIYEARMGKMGEVFAKVVRMEPRKETGILASWVEEITGKVPVVLVPIVCEVDETVTVALALGRGFSLARSWQRLVTFARNWGIDNGRD